MKTERCIQTNLVHLYQALKLKLTRLLFLLYICSSDTWYSNILVVTIIGVIVLNSLQVFTFHHHNHQLVKASSPRLSHFAFCGCYILVVSVVADVIIETFPNRYDVVDRYYLLHARNSFLFLV